MVAHSLQARIEKLGWRSLDERLWQRLGEFRHAIIAPPLDTVPSDRGNAIYTLVETLAAQLPDPTLVLARWPEQGQPAQCGITDRILYDTAPFRASWLEKRLPYRLKRWATGSGEPILYSYARRAGQLCRWLPLTHIVIEDIPMYAPVIHRFALSRQRLYLHQHSNAPQVVQPFRWKRMVAAISGVAFVARATLNDTERWQGPVSIPAQVIYNGVNLNQYDLALWRTQGHALRKAWEILPDDPVLLYPGRIVPHKGAVEAAEAFAAVGHPNAHLVVVGDLDGSLYADANYTRRLRAVADQNPRRIHLVGSVSQAEIPAYYALADVVIVPSLGHEGLPKVITEALAMLRPCIVTQRGGALELIRDGVNGWVVPEPATVANIALTIRRAWAEKDQVRVSERTRQWMSDARMVAQFEQFLRSPSSVLPNDFTPDEP